MSAAAVGLMFRGAAADRLASALAMRGVTTLGFGVSRWQASPVRTGVPTRGRRDVGEGVVAPRFGPRPHLQGFRYLEER